MIAIKREAAFRAHYPLHRLIGTGFFAEKVFPHFVIVTYVINISEVDRKIRVRLFHRFSYCSRFIRAGAPISGHAYVHAVVNLVDASSLSLCRVIPERMFLVKPELHYLWYPL